MKVFLRGYFGKIYGRGIIEEVSYSSKNISLILKDLEKEGILKFEISGNRKYYSLNLDNSLINFELGIFEDLRRLEFFQKNKKFLDFLSGINAQIVCVFGSYAKERNVKGSDLDLFVVGKVDVNRISKLGKDIGINVQVFNISFKDFVKSVKGEIVKEVLKNHVIIKGGDLFIKEILKWEK